jgi:phosphatidylinositol alpha-mannosyltransferase
MATKQQTYKIGFVLDDGLDKPDGVQQYILTLGAWLSDQGHDVHYLVGQTTRTDIKNVHSLSKNIHVRFNGNRMSIPLPTSSRKLQSFLKAEQFDILHVQMPYSPFMGHRLIKVAPPETAVVGTFHIAPNSWVVQTGTYLLGIWLKESLRRFRAIVSVSPAAARFAKSTFRIKSEILPNVVDYSRFHAAKPLAKLKQDKPTILYLGRLVPRKGAMILLKAVSLLTADPSVPEFKVLLCGTGPLLNDAKRYIREHSLDTIVSMEGFITEEDKPNYYASADISVFPSTGGESFGIVLLEAMASGKSAVLAGNNPGYASVLESNTGLLFPVHDAQALAQAIKSMLLDLKARSDAADWGAAFTRDFDVPVVGRKLEAIYMVALRNKQ